MYQAFLSALSYHRWHGPVTGTIERAYVVDGTYYLGNRYMGFISGEPDPSAPNDSLFGRLPARVELPAADRPRRGRLRDGLRLDNRGPHTC